MKKNDVFTAEITDMTLEGSGVTHIDGIAVFVPNTAIGDVVEIKIVKALKSYSYGIVMNIIKPSVYRINSNCKISDKCGGCTYRHISYEAELALKKNIVEQTFARIGNINVPCDDIIGSSREDYYRNKAQYPFGEQGCGFYAKRSHRIIECDECKLQPNIFDKIK
ncbi:MAG: TRAM domain-containing protein, partial [Oscillospiraceae bacterium]